MSRRTSDGSGGSTSGGGGGGCGREGGADDRGRRAEPAGGSGAGSPGRGVQQEAGAPRNRHDSILTPNAPERVSSKNTTGRSQSPWPRQVVWAGQSNSTRSSGELEASPLTGAGAGPVATTGVVKARSSTPTTGVGPGGGGGGGGIGASEGGTEHREPLPRRDPELVAFSNDSYLHRLSAQEEAELRAAILEGFARNAISLTRIVRRTRQPVQVEPAVRSRSADTTRGPSRTGASAPPTTLAHSTGAASTGAASPHNKSATQSLASATNGPPATAPAAAAQSPPQGHHTATTAPFPAMRQYGNTAQGGRAATANRADDEVPPSSARFPRRAIAGASGVVATTLPPEAVAARFVAATAAARTPDPAQAFAAAARHHENELAVTGQHRVPGASPTAANTAAAAADRRSAAGAGAGRGARQPGDDGSGGCARGAGAGGGGRDGRHPRERWCGGGSHRQPRDGGGGGGGGGGPLPSLEPLLGEEGERERQLVLAVTAVTGAGGCGGEERGGGGSLVEEEGEGEGAVQTLFTAPCPLAWSSASSSLSPSISPPWSLSLSPSASDEEGASERGIPSIAREGPKRVAGSDDGAFRCIPPIRGTPVALGSSARTPSLFYSTTSANPWDGTALSSSSITLRACHSTTDMRDDSCWVSLDDVSPHPVTPSRPPPSDGLKASERRGGAVATCRLCLAAGDAVSELQAPVRGLCMCRGALGFAHTHCVKGSGLHRCPVCLHAYMLPHRRASLKGDLMMADKWRLVALRGVLLANLLFGEQCGGGARHVAWVVRRGARCTLRLVLSAACAVALRVLGALHQRFRRLARGVGLAFF